jgi:hypothetical protein
MALPFSSSDRNDLADCRQLVAEVRVAPSSCVRGTGDRSCARAAEVEVLDRRGTRGSLAEDTELEDRHGDGLHLTTQTHLRATPVDRAVTVSV